MTDRRVFLAGSGALALLGLAACATTRTLPQGKAGRDAELEALLSAWFREDLQDIPTFATELGLDVGELAHLRHRLGDVSFAAVAKQRRQAIERYRQLLAFDADGLSDAGRLNYDVTISRASTRAEGARFDYGHVRGRPTPYIVSQLGGGYHSVPVFLESQHPIATRVDAEAYIDRLEAYGPLLVEETKRVAYDVSVGAVPPDFIIDATVASLRRARSAAANESPLVESLRKRTREQGIAGDWEAQATRLVAGPIADGLDRQIRFFQDLRPSAHHDAGVWRLPEGEAYYAACLRYSTNTSLDAEEVHRIGLEQVAELQAQIDTLLRAQGFTEGTVGERLNILKQDPRLLYPNTDAGRAEILADLERQMAQIEPLLPRVFNVLPRGKVAIRRIPEQIEAGAPPAYYDPPSRDGSRPGVYYVNLRDTADLPKYTLRSLAYHEAIPGHHLQNALEQEVAAVPLHRSMQVFPAYSEGWAVYAEQVADELGAYENDALGRIGFLHFYLFRAARLVVDSGLHHKRWSREQAIGYMTEQAAQPQGMAVREVDRYNVWPANACAYKIGHNVIVGLREEARRKMGGRFDIRQFHDLVLLGGEVPLDVLERRVRAWIVRLSS